MRVICQCRRGGRGEFEFGAGLDDSADFVAGVGVGGDDEESGEEVRWDAVGGYKALI